MRLLPLSTLQVPPFASGVSAPSMDITMIASLISCTWPSPTLSLSGCVADKITLSPRLKRRRSTSTLGDLGIASVIWKPSLLPLPLCSPFWPFLPSFLPSFPLPLPLLKILRAWRPAKAHPPVAKSSADRLEVLLLIAAISTKYSRWSSAQKCPKYLTESSGPETRPCSLWRSNLCKASTQRSSWDTKPQGSSWKYFCPFNFRRQSCPGGNSSLLSEKPNNPVFPPTCVPIHQPLWLSLWLSFRFLLADSLRLWFFPANSWKKQKTRVSAESIESINTVFWYIGRWCWLSWSKSLVRAKIPFSSGQTHPRSTSVSGHSCPLTSSSLTDPSSLSDSSLSCSLFQGWHGGRHSPH